MADATLLEENFTISNIISGKYDRVHRIVGTSQSGDISMTLDVNVELFPIGMGESVHLLVASTLSTEGSKEESKGWRDVTRGEPTLADHYEYVCHGKVYRFEQGDGGNIKAFASFGGLLLFMDGPHKKLTPMRIDYIYLLMRKT